MPRISGADSNTKDWNPSRINKKLDKVLRICVRLFSGVVLMGDATKQSIHKNWGFRGKDHPDAKASSTYPEPLFLWS